MRWMSYISRHYQLSHCVTDENEARDILQNGLWLVVRYLGAEAGGLLITSLDLTKLSQD